MRLRGVSLGMAALAIVATLALPANRASAQAVGFIAALEGEVEIQPEAATSWEAALLDRNVEIGDVLRTGIDSAVKILLADDTVLTLGESTELQLDTFVVGDAATREPSVLRLLKGKARTLVGEAFGGPTRLEMHTPTAIIGVKGTAFDAFLISDPTRGLWTLACNISGSIWVRHTDRNLGTVEPRPGLCTRVFPDSPPEDEVPRPEWSQIPSIASKEAPSFAPETPLPAVSPGSSEIDLGTEIAGGDVGGLDVIESGGDARTVSQDSVQEMEPMGLPGDQGDPTP